MLPVNRCLEMEHRKDHHCRPEHCEAKVRLDVEFHADVKEIDSVIEKVVALAREMKCAEGCEGEIELALHESLVNAVVHGAQCDCNKTVRCWVACDPDDGILIVVRDPGPGFDPKALPVPTEGENVYSHHGRGIFLINQLMDHVEFRDGGREIRMHKATNGNGKS